MAVNTRISDLDFLEFIISYIFILVRPKIFALDPLIKWIV